MSSPSGRTRYVLSITGGGSKNLLSAVVLNAIQQHWDCLTKDLFDLIVGSGEGGVLALLAASGIGTHLDMTSFFSQKNLRKMMDKGCLDHMMGEVQFDPVYDGKGKTSVLKRYLGDETLMSELETQVAVPVYNISNAQPEIFTSYDQKSAKFPVWQVADATTATVPYFPPVKIPLNGCCYLGGGFVANNPTMVAYTEARRLFGPDAPLRILSLDAGYACVEYEQKTREMDDWGAVQWFCNGLLNIMVNAPGEIVMDQTQKILSTEDMKGNRLLRLSTTVPYMHIYETASEKLQILRELGTELFCDHQNDLIDFFDSRSSRCWGDPHHRFNPCSIK